MAAIATKEQLAQLLDSLYLELLSLIEQQTACRVNIERLSNGGQLLLAKTRYVQGTQTVGITQIPTENGNEFNALCRVVEQSNDDAISQVEYKLQRFAVDKGEGYVDPLKWFGALPPSSLRAAAEQFKKCLDLVVESANLQRELSACMDSIERLKLLLKAQA